MSRVGLPLELGAEGIVPVEDVDDLDENGVLKGDEFFDSIEESSVV